ncbi:hypothetical protein C8R46DRAFT_1181090 [Mycena filopes]|nr:hypothetical protein C8R46DRAFT_1181090 [Mycena filopes]
MASTTTAVQILFLELTHHIWPEIMPPGQALPVLLPPLVADFLGSVLGLEPSIVQLTWHAFSDLAEASQLGEESIVEGRLYTLRRGVLPIFSKSLYCHACHIRYYNNYYVRDASEPTARRTYYSHEIPKLIHVTETTYVEPDLCQYFRIQMAQSQTCLTIFLHYSGTCQGISRVYNYSLASRLSNDLTGDLVLDSFLLHAILQDKQARREPLSLPHHGHQNHRFDEALAERNYRMAGTGQPMWAHACNRCMKIYQGEDGNWYRMTAGVHDGVTVRHLCCSVHDCQEALPTQRHHFCLTHEHLLQQCCIRGCSQSARPGFRTCTTETHVAFQADAEERNAAMFQLRSRLSRSSTSPEVLASTSTPTGLPTTSHPSTTRLKGSLARSWTHNEQLFVRCCGIIISRATFFGSEGISGVKDFLKATFPPEYPGSLPSYIFYDNILKHLHACGDTYFDSVGLPVDVFHFKCKHSEADVFCQIHCNPARFRELIDSEGKWVFNSSVAEQANVWFGKFQNIVQDMVVLKYNFFLDEMISIHNELTAAELQAKGHAPHIQSDVDHT